MNFGIIRKLKILSRVELGARGSEFLSEILLWWFIETLMHALRFGEFAILQQQKKKVLLSLRSYLVPSSSVVVCRFVPIKNNILEIRHRENVLYGRYWHMKLSTMDLCSLLLWATYRVKWRFIYEKTKREECGSGEKCLCGRTREEIRNCFFNNI